MPLQLGSHVFGDDETVVMAIVNRTPDSFYDRGATFAEAAALAAVDRAVAEGAGIVDIGGVKAGPGAEVDADGGDPAYGVARGRRPRRGTTSSSASTPGGPRSGGWSAPRARTCSTTPGAGSTRSSRASPRSTASAWSARTPAAPRRAPGRTGWPTTTSSPTSWPRRSPRPSARSSLGRRRGDRSWSIPATTSARTPGTRSRPPGACPSSSPPGGRSSCPCRARTSWARPSTSPHPPTASPGTLATTAVSAWLGARVYRAHDVAATRQTLDMVASIAGTRPPAVARRGLA